MNKVILIGRVGKEPVVTDTVAKFSLATDGFKDGEKITEWHSIKVFGKLKDTVEKYVKKGARLGIEGRIQTQKWEEKFYTDVVVERLEIIDFPEKTNVIDFPTKEKPAGDEQPDGPAPFADDDVPF